MSNEHEFLELEPNTSLTNRTRTEHPKSSVRFVKLIGRKMLFELVFGKLIGRAYRTRTRTEPSELTEQFGSFTALTLTENLFEVESRFIMQLQLLEEKHGLSGTHVTGSVISETEKLEEDSHRKPLSSALEEVRQKGTLMDRLAILESRVLQVPKQSQKSLKRNIVFIIHM